MRACAGQAGEGLGLRVGWSGKTCQGTLRGEKVALESRLPGELSSMGTLRGEKAALES